MTRLRQHSAFQVAALVATLGTGVPSAQERTPEPAARPAAPSPTAPVRATAVPDGRVAGRDANETREDLRRVLAALPSQVVQAIRYDPSLLQNATYVAPYPALATFIEEHAEVMRNPSFFIDQPDRWRSTPQDRSIEILEETLGGIAILTGVSLFMGLIVWLARTLMDHRKWLRLSRTQAEVHTKLLDRLTTNEDLLTYIQTAPGRRFLESAPITLDGEPRPGGAPLSRVIWSLQAGVVLAALGSGLFVAQRQVPAEVAPGVGVMATVILALGVGFAISAGLAYAITSKAGLIPQSRVPSHE